MMRPFTLLLATILLLPGIARAGNSPSSPPSSSIDEIDPYRTPGGRLPGEEIPAQADRPPSPPLDDEELAEIDTIRHTRFNLTGHMGAMWVDGDRYEPGFCYGGDVALEQSPHFLANANIRYAKLRPAGLEVEYDDPNLDIFSFAIGATYRSAPVPETAFYVGAGIGATSYQVPQIALLTSAAPVDPSKRAHVEKVRISSITLNARLGVEYPVLGSQRLFLEAGFVRNLQEVNVEWAIPVTAGIVLNF